MLEREQVFPNLIRARAGTRGDEQFLLDVEGSSYTYGRLAESMGRWASVVRALGVEPGRTVVTLLRNIVDSLPVWLGVASAGAIEVPINVFFRGHMLRYVINDSDAEVLIVDAMFLDQLREVAPDLTSIKTLVVIGEPAAAADLPFTVHGAAGLLEDASGAIEGAGPERWDTACIIYTSGTTGPSKGVLVPWYELYQFATAVPPGLMEPGGSHYNFLPFFHVGGKGVAWLTSLNDARMVQREWFSVTEFWSDIKRFGCRSAGLIGTTATLLYRAEEHPDSSGTPLTHVTMGPLIPEVEDFKRRFGVVVATGFGMTEVGVPLMTDGFNLPNERSCGKPRPGYRVRVADEHDESVAPGVVGELLVRTDEPWMMTAGYWKQPERTAEAWRNGWFHTGDAFMVDEDGNHYFVDRIKDAIRRRGENISSFEVEQFVLEHPAIQECAAVGVPSELTEDDVKVVVVRKPDQALTEEELVRFLIARMPRFMVPRYVEFADALPKTPTFRTRKVELRADAVNERTWDREAAGIEIPR